MATAPQRTFRPAALESAVSPEQLDHLVNVTRPADWIIILVVLVAVAAALTWGILGRVPTRVSGEGILIGNGGKVVDAVSAAAGKLQSVAVAVGDHKALDHRAIGGQPDGHAIGVGQGIEIDLAVIRSLAPGGFGDAGSCGRTQ